MSARVFRGSVVSSLALGLGCNAILGYDDAQLAPTTGGEGGTAAGAGATSTAGHGGAASGGGGGTPAGQQGGSGGAGGAGGEGGDSGPVDPFCDQRFGDLDAYQLCSSDAATCTFFRSEHDSNCGATCSRGGVSCLSALDQDGSNKCTPLEDASCSTELNDMICICRKRCGVDPACAAPDQCVGGTCTSP